MENFYAYTHSLKGSRFIHIHGNDNYPTVYIWYGTSRVHEWHVCDNGNADYLQESEGWGTDLEPTEARAREGIARHIANGYMLDAETDERRAEYLNGILDEMLEIVPRSLEDVYRIVMLDHFDSPLNWQFDDDSCLTWVGEEPDPGPDYEPDEIITPEYDEDDEYLERIGC